MPHVGRIPSTLEKYRHALSAYLEDVTQLNCKSSSSFLYFDEKTNHQYGSNDELLFNQPHTQWNNSTDNTKSLTPIPDTETRINASYNTVKKQLDLLSSYFSLIHEDLHGDLLLLRTNLNLLPSNTLHIFAQQNTNNSPPSLHSNSNHITDDEENYGSEQSKTNYSHHSLSTPTPTTSSDVDEFNLDNILNTKQTQSIQYIVSILQKFIKYNAILVEYIQQNKSKIDSFWVQNNILNHPQIHKLNLDV
jgi:hypothetical protein